MGLVDGLRKRCLLNGLWDFVFLGNVPAEEVKPQAERTWTKTLVPSAFDALPDLAGQRGCALYRTTLPAGGRARLTFGAVSMWCRVWVDGAVMKDHACGYAPFVVDIPACQNRPRELVVLADNRFDFDRAPMHEESFDFYQYGGILREVSMESLPEEGFFLDHVHVLPTDEYASGHVEVHVVLEGAEMPEAVDFEVQIDCGTSVVFSEVPVQDGRASVFAVVPNPCLWSPETPYMHQAIVRLCASGDALAVRFGLRRIEAREGKLWLNGKELKLLGFNRHEWHPNFGPCTPQGQMYADLQLLKRLGCNFVRGSHYPQDQRFLDLCDELGMLVWEENLGWGQRERTFASEKFLGDHDESLRAMVRASGNHPSVIVWGFLNEAATNEQFSRACFEESVRTLRALDPSRLISFASMHAEEDLHFDLVDLISLNIYPGWYGCEDEPRPLDLIAPRWEKCFASIDARGFRNKPVLISETGVEALYGCHDAHADFFSEEYQAEYLQRSCNLAVTHDRCCGIAIWHFSDARTYGGGRSLLRPRTFNNKGVFDEFRRPKLAAETVRKIFTAAE